MSTSLHDIDSQAALAVGFPPTALSESDTGAALDLADGDGPVFAVLLTGTLDPGTTVAVAFEESDSSSGGWAAVSGGAVPTTAASDAVGCASFARTKRYVRCQITLAGTSPQAVVAVLVGHQKKVL